MKVHGSCSTLMKLGKVIVVLLIGFCIWLIFVGFTIPQEQQDYYRDRENQKQYTETNNTLYKESVQHSLDVVTVVL